MAVNAIPNPKKSTQVDFPIEKVKLSVQNISLRNNKYKFSKANEIFNQYTFESLEFLSIGVYVDINLNKITEDKTEITVEIRRKIGTFNQSYEITNANEHIEKTFECIAFLITKSPDEIEQYKVSQAVNKIASKSNQNFKNNFENGEEKPWYEKIGLVILLCVLFFPVGVYALWKNSSISKGWKIGVTAIIVIIVIVNLGDKDNNSNGTTSTTEVLNEEKQGLVESELPKEETTKWRFQEDVDKMTSKTVKYASIDANEELDFKFPYDGGSVASLTIRKKDGSNDIYLLVSKGQFNGTYDGGQVRIKFDEEQPKKFSFSAPSDNSSDMIFLNSTKTIISKLKTSKKIIIEAEFFNEGNRQMEFDVTGFKWE